MNGTRSDLGGPDRPAGDAETSAPGGVPTGPDRLPFQYVVVRIVPRVERGEFVNAGVILHCDGLDWIGVRFGAEVERLTALDPDVDLVAVEAALLSIRGTVEGTGGPQAIAPPGARFRWLAAPRSAVVQPGPVHTGLTSDPEAELGRLFTDLVA